MKGLEEYLLNSDLAEYRLNSCLGEEELTLLVLAEIHQIGLAAQGFPKIKKYLIKDCLKWQVRPDLRLLLYPHQLRDIESYIFLSSVYSNTIFCF